MKIFLLRHASPDWSRKDIPYDIQPGPPLSPKGELEALQLAEFLKPQKIARLYFSPFERSARTAKIVATANGISLFEDVRLVEWREASETEEQVKDRMSLVFKQIINENINGNAIGLVSHGGPIALLLQELGMSPERLAEYRKKFDRTNPLPPAGAWKVERNETGQTWDFDLAFTP